MLIGLLKVYCVPACLTVPHLFQSGRKSGVLFIHVGCGPDYCNSYLDTTCACLVMLHNLLMLHALAGIGHACTCLRTHACHGLVCLLPHAFITTGHACCWIIASVIDHIPWQHHCHMFWLGNFVCFHMLVDGPWLGAPIFMPLL